MKRLYYFVIGVLLLIAIVLSLPKYYDMTIAEGAKAFAQDFKSESLFTGADRWFQKDILQASGNFTSNPIDVRKIFGYISLQMAIGNSTKAGPDPGSGNATIIMKYKISNDGNNFIDPPGIDNTIATGLGITSGDDSDGKVFYQVSPPPCAYIVFYAENEDRRGNCSITADVNTH